MIKKIGEKITTKQGAIAEIIEICEIEKNVIVKMNLKGYEIIKKVQFQHLKNNQVNFRTDKERFYCIEQINNEYVLNNGNIVKVIKPGSKKGYCIIQFKEPYKFELEVGVGNLIKGNIKNPLHKNVFNKGTHGIGKYNYENHKIIYKKWQGILSRCYYKKNNNKKFYENVKICNEWHNFQKFAAWYEENYIEGFDLDKDLLSDEDNKIYSPETCCFLPKEINCFINNKDAIGFTKSKNLFVSKINTKKKNFSIGYYDNEKKARLMYLEIKNIIFINLIKKYRKKIKFSFLIKILSKNEKEDLRNLRKSIIKNKKDLERISEIKNKIK